MKALSSWYEYAYFVFLPILLGFSLILTVACGAVTQANEAKAAKQAEVGAKSAEYGVALKACQDGSTNYTTYEACAAKADIQFDRKDRNR